ncbi:MAG: hypothetical protein ACFFCV_12175 [Promethearchaeota archaeon]
MRVKKGNFNFKSGYRIGGVGLEKILPEVVSTKPMVLHSILLFFLYKR